MRINKTIFYNIILLLFISCSKDKKNDTNKPILVESNNTLTSIPKESKIPTDKFNINFIGKTTFEIKKYNVYECWEKLIEGETENKNDEFAVSHVTETLDDCTEGNGKILLEKFINREKGKANFEIKDQLIVKSNYPKICYSTLPLKLNGEIIGNNYLIEFEDNSKDSLEIIYSIWRIDLLKMKFVETKIPKNFKCLNPDFFED
jgi:hypothetical protein